MESKSYQGNRNSGGGGGGGGGGGRQKEICAKSAIGTALGSALAIGAYLEVLVTGLVVGLRMGLGLVSHTGKLNWGAVLTGEVSGNALEARHSANLLHARYVSVFDVSSLLSQCVCMCLYVCARARDALQMPMS